MPSSSSKDKDKEKEVNKAKKVYFSYQKKKVFIHISLDDRWHETEIKRGIRWEIK
jgi:hypothetical protein